MARLGYLEIGEVTSPLVREMFAYWEEMRAGRPLPLKADFDPSRVPRLLPYLTLEEVHRDPFRIRYRLVGTEQARFAAEDFTGRWLHELAWEPKVVEGLLEQYRLVLESRAPVFGASMFLWIDGYEKAFEWGVFPLATDGETISHFIAIEDFYNVDRAHILQLVDEQLRSKGPA